MSLGDDIRCRKLIWLFVAALPLWPQLAAEDTKTIDEKEALALAVYTPRPNYPYEARLRREQGTGIAIVTTDPATGYAANAVMAVSTGFPSLDNTAISTFRQWRFKPGRVLKVRIPVTFFLSGGGGPVVAVVHVEKALPMASPRSYSQRNRTNLVTELSDQLMA